jgi:hypothetical protein
MTQGHLATRFRIHSVFTNKPTQPFLRSLESHFVVWPFSNPRHYLLSPLLSASTNLVFHTSFLSHFVFLRSVRPLLVTANVVPSSSILVTLMKEVLSSSETSVLIRATRRNIPEDDILHSHCRENLKSYIALTGWTM